MTFTIHLAIKRVGVCFEGVEAVAAAILALVAVSTPDSPAF